MPSYTLPNFNLLANLWTCDGTIKPSSGSPDVVNVPVQKYISSRQGVPLSLPADIEWFVPRTPMIQLRFPRSGSFSGTWTSWKVVCSEVPAGSGQYYRTLHQEVQHEGFPNEYALLTVTQCSEDLEAITPAGGNEATGRAADACGSVPPGDTFLDTFTDVPGTEIEDHVADTGESWLDSNHTLEIVGSGVGMEAVDSAAGFIFAFADYAGPEDGTIILIFTTPSDISNDGVSAGAICRMDATNTGLLLWVRCDNALTNTHMLVWSDISGSLYPGIDESATFSMDVDTRYDVEIGMSGDTLLGTLVNQDTSTVIATVNITSSLYAGNTGVGLMAIKPALDNAVLNEGLSKD